MAEPRYVRVMLTHGRSVPVSYQGVSRRLRKGETGVVPVEVYRRYAWKMKLVDEGEYERLTAAVQADEVMKRAEEEVEELEELPEWEVKIPPEEYYELYKDKENPSPTLVKRLKLAKQLMER